MLLTATNSARELKPESLTTECIGRQNGYEEKTPRPPKLARNVKAIYQTAGYRATPRQLKQKGKINRDVQARPRTCTHEPTFSSSDFTRKLVNKASAFDASMNWYSNPRPISSNEIIETSFVAPFTYIS